MCLFRSALCVPQEAGSSDADSVNHRFISTALPHLVPLLLEQLTKQEEGQETDDGVWNVSMAAGTCLALCASVARDAIVPLVMPYVTANIQVSTAPGAHCLPAFGSSLESQGASAARPKSIAAEESSSSFRTQGAHATGEAF